MTNNPAVPAISRDEFRVNTSDEAGLPVAVEFSASWCSSCRAMAPVLLAVAAKFEGQVRVFQVDVDAYPELADEHEVRSLPTLVLFKGGEAVGRIIGVVPQHTLVAAFQALIDESVQVES